MMRGQGRQERVPEKPTIRLSQWLHGFKASSSVQLRTHVLNFLLAEGHYQLAKQFSKQSGAVVGELDEIGVMERERIKKLVQQSQIDEAIQAAIALVPDVFDEKSSLLFHLKSLKVIQLIKLKRIEEAIAVAKKQLLPPVILTQTGLQEELQRVMSLIAFVNVKECLSYRLTTAQYRNEVANELNQALLGDNSSGQCLNHMISLNKWSEKKLEGFANFPRVSIVAKNIYS